MTDLYDFTWVHEEARHIKYGLMTLELKVHGGDIVHAALVRVLKQRSLKDTQPLPEEELLA